MLQARKLKEIYSVYFELSEKIHFRKRFSLQNSPKCLNFFGIYDKDIFKILIRILYGLYRRRCEGDVK